MAKEPIDKITILRGTVFGGRPVEAGDTLDVAAHEQADARLLIRTGKAVAGVAAKKPAAPKNKAITEAETR